MTNLDNEISEIQRETTRKMRKENSNALFFCLLAYLVFFAVHGACLYGSTTVINHAVNGNGCAWKCQKCEQRVWRDSSRKDWAGNYYCPRCGAQK